jgi:hypothetical protein
MANSVVVGVDRGFANTIAAGCIGFWPGAQPSGDTTLLDRSGRGAHSSTLWSNTTPWGTAGYFTSVNTSGQFAKIPIAKWPHRFATDSLLVFGQAIVTKEAGASALFGNGLNTTNTGFLIRCTSTGQLDWGSYGTGASEFEGGTTETPWDSAVLASFAAAFDRPTQTIRLFVNGARAANYVTPSSLALAPATLDGGTLVDIGIGGGTNGNETAANIKNIQAYYRTGSLPLDIDGIVRRLHNSPSVPLTVAEWDTVA